MKSIKVPQPADFPAVVAAEKKLTDLRARERELAGQIEGLLSARREGAAKSDLSTAAGVLLKTGTIPARSRETDPREQAEALERDRAVVRRAIELQADELDKARRLCAADASRMIRKEWLGLVKTAAEHARGFAESVTEMQRVFRELSEAGLYHPELLPDARPHARILAEFNLADVSSWIRQWLAEVERAGK